MYKNKKKKSGKVSHFYGFRQPTPVDFPARRVKCEWFMIEGAEADGAAELLLF